MVWRPPPGGALSWVVCCHVWVLPRPVLFRRPVHRKTTLAVTWARMGGGVGCSCWATVWPSGSCSFLDFSLAGRLSIEKTPFPPSGTVSVIVFAACCQQTLYPEHCPLASTPFQQVKKTSDHSPLLLLGSSAQAQMEGTYGSSTNLHQVSAYDCGPWHRQLSGFFQMSCQSSPMFCSLSPYKSRWELFAILLTILKQLSCCFSFGTDETSTRQCILDETAALTSIRKL